jgi:hypothetical protein
MKTQERALTMSEVRLVVNFLVRHISGDWGDISSIQRLNNLFAGGSENRIYSRYHLSGDTVLCIASDPKESTITIKFTNSKNAPW